MDLISYLRPARKFLVFAAIATLLVGLVTAYAVNRSTKGTYQASLRLSLPTFSGQARDLDQTIADFIDEIGSTEARDAATKASGISPGELAGTLSARRLTQSGSDVQVTATGRDKVRLAQAVAAASQSAYTVLARPHLDAAESLLTQLQDTYDKVKVSPTGASKDEQRWQSQAEFAAMRAATDARSALLDLQVRTALVERSTSVSAVTVTPAPRTAQIVQSALTNAGAALFALVALMVAMELWKTRPSREAARRAAGESPHGDDAPAAADSSDAYSREADSPEADSPEADSPEADSREADSPEADSPEADSPEADSPEADSPEADSPEADPITAADEPKEKPQQLADLSAE